jgi:hypothetical protein
MRHLVRSAAATTVAFLGLAAGALAQTGDRCTHDVLTVDASPISATFCVSGPTAQHVVVTETFARGDQSFSRPLAVAVVDGATITRAVDDVGLAALGSTKSLHLTLAYRDGIATLEHALLLPGAVVLK